MENIDRKYYFIKEKNDLAFLKTIKSLFYKYDEVRLDLKTKDEKFSKEWENKINRYYKACGCGEGKFFVLIFFLSSILYLRINKTLYFSYSNIGFVFLMCLIGAFVGKIIGQFLAHNRLKQALIKMESFL